MRRYLREHLKDELGEDLWEALDELAYVHAVVWTEFDPTMQRGDKDQPADIKEALKRIRDLFKRRGLCIEGFEKKNEVVE